MTNYAKKALQDFLSRATSATYAGGGAYEKSPERPGFLELVFDDGDWHYRDSYTGFYRSSGSEVIRYRDQVVWVSSYCGGMVAGREHMAKDTFSFLKQAMLAKPDWSFRGPSHLQSEDWEYRYVQKGDIESFSGHEEIMYQGVPVFSHDIMGIMTIEKKT